MEDTVEDTVEVAPGVLVEFYVHQMRGATQYMKRSLARVYLPASEARDFESTRGAPVKLPPALHAAATAGLRVRTADAHSSVRMAIGMIKTQRRIGMVQQMRNGGEAWLRRAVVAPDLRLETLQCTVCEAAIFDGHYACWQHREQCTICVRCWSDHHSGLIPPPRPGAGGPRGVRPRVSLRDPSSAAAGAGAARLGHSLFGDADGASAPSASGGDVVHRQQHFAYSRRWTDGDLAAVIQALHATVAASPPSAPPLGRKRAAPDSAAPGAALSAAQQQAQQMPRKAHHARAQRQTHRPRRIAQSLDLTPSELPLQREPRDTAAGQMTGAKILGAVFDAFSDLRAREVYPYNQNVAPRDESDGALDGDVDSEASEVDGSSGALHGSVGASGGVAGAAVGVEGGGACGGGTQGAAPEQLPAGTASSSSVGRVLRAVFNPHLQTVPQSKVSHRVLQD